MTIALLLIMAGCSTAPVRKPARLPPVPPGFTNVMKRQTTARAAVAFVPTSVVPTGDMEISELYSDPEFGNFYIVSGIQFANHSIKFEAQDRVGGPWLVIGTWSTYPVEQRVGISVQAGLPARWVRDCNTPSFAPAAAFVASTGVDTGRNIKMNGKSYRLVRLSPAGAEFTMYRLKPL